MLGMANVMPNHPEYFYFIPVGVQDISDEDEATSYPIVRSAPISIPRCTAAPEGEIVDVDTLKRKAIDGDTAVVVSRLVIEKVRTVVSFYYVGCAYCKKRMIVEKQAVFVAKDTHV